MVICPFPDDFDANALVFDDLDAAVPGRRHHHLFVRQQLGRLSAAFPPDRDVGVFSQDKLVLHPVINLLIGAWNLLKSGTPSFLDIQFDFLRYFWEICI
jgi:hypothetical protein